MIAQVPLIPQGVPVGNVATFACVFLDDSKAPPLPTDPTSINFRYVDPTGTETVVTGTGGGLVKASQGSYSYGVTLHLPGLYTGRWDATGGMPVASVASQDVQVLSQGSALVTSD